LRIEAAALIDQTQQTYSIYRGKWDFVMKTLSIKASDEIARKFKAEADESEVLLVGASLRGLTRGRRHHFP